MRISGGAAGSALRIFNEPRLSGRSWHTEAVKPENGCSFSPILSVENGMKWIWMLGDAKRGLVLKNAPDVPAAIVNGPRRTGLLTTSLSVMRCGQRVTMRTCR